MTSPRLLGPASAGLVLLGLTSTAAVAEPRIGTAVRIVNDVTADQRQMTTGDGVNQNETIEVKPASLGELKLDDDTKLALGPGARLKLDRFVYDPAATTGDVAVSLVKGAFRFVTGSAQKKDYKIRTPSASISVRGTVFDVYIADNGAEYLLLHQGAIEVCKGDGTDRTTCRVLVNPCNVVRVAPQGNVSRPQGWGDRNSELDLTFSEAFPFVLTPPDIDPVVYHSRADVEANTCRVPSTPIPGGRAEFDTPGQPAPSTLPAAGAPSAIATYEPGSRSRPPSQYEPSTPVDTSETGEDPAPPLTDVPPVAVSWTGVYIGVHGGGTHGQRDTEGTCRQEDGFDAPANFCARDGRVEPENLTEIYDLGGGDAMGGVQIGGNVQVGPLVLGIEADVSRTTVDQEFPGDADTRRFYYYTTVSQKMEWMGTARSRAGLAFGNVMVFATGGVAMADVSYGVVLEDLSRRFAFENEQSETKVGWTGGGGFEIGLGPVSLKTEYLYYDLGDDKFETEFGRGIGVYQQSDFENRGHVARFGINFRLN